MDWNTQLFLWLNATSPAGASAATQAGVLQLAIFLAQYLIALLPLSLLALCWRGDAAQRRAVLHALLAIVLTWAVVLWIDHVYPHPRPFMLGLGQLRIAHAPTPSFPSHHLSPWWAGAFALCLNRSTRLWGVALALLGLPMAWARIYLGVHFPLDMLGAATVGASSAAVTAVLLLWFWRPALAVGLSPHPAKVEDAMPLASAQP